MKLGQFVEMEYVGRLETGEVFDSTDPKDLENAKGPLTIIMGAGHLIKGIEKAMLEMKVGDKCELDIPPEDGFGKRDAKLIKLFQLREFKKQNIVPYPGLKLTLDNKMGTVISVSSGRIIVDFNNPLTGRRLAYKIKINRIVSDLDEQIKGLLMFHFGKELKYSKEGEKIVIEGVPDFAQERLRTELLTYTVFKTVEFIGKTDGDIDEKNDQESNKSKEK
ncbi:MAG: peptidylprolyl isomerase [Candidatus Altiarchaeota archaeon]|nr:peptidylprolyl isomerase [Candidatus Altiarchaeota archaeon]